VAEDGSKIFFVKRVSAATMGVILSVV